MLITQIIIAILLADLIRFFILETEYVKNLIEYVIENIIAIAIITGIVILMIIASISG